MPRHTYEDNPVSDGYLTGKWACLLVSLFLLLALAACLVIDLAAHSPLFTPTPQFHILPVPPSRFTPH